MSAKVKYLICPKCGRRTRHVTPYQDGSFLYVHAQKKVNAPFPHMEILAACNSTKMGVVVWTPT